jgi:uncharacterized protein with HEPN domain
MIKDDSLYLKHILDAIAKIKTYTQNKTLKEFENNNLLQDGVIREIEIIGEAAKMLSKQLKEKYNQVPWKDIAGMRDKLIHGYFGVDLGAVWKTVKEDIPALEENVKKILAGI